MKKDERSRLFAFFDSEGKRLERYERAKVSRISDMDAQDIVRGVMRSLIRRSDTGGPVENIAAYTYRSVRNRIAVYQAEKARTVLLDGFADEDEAFSLREMFKDYTTDTKKEEIIK